MKLIQYASMLNHISTSTLTDVSDIDGSQDINTSEIVWRSYEISRFFVHLIHFFGEFILILINTIISGDDLLSEILIPLNCNDFHWILVYFIPMGRKNLYEIAMNDTLAYERMYVLRLSC